LTRGFGSVEKGNEKELSTSRATFGFESMMALIEYRKIMSSVAFRIWVKCKEDRVEVDPDAEI
jgi:hypothetical protein